MHGSKCVPSERAAFAQNDEACLHVSYRSSQSADEREKQSKLRKDIELLQVLRNTVSASFAFLTVRYNFEINEVGVVIGSPGSSLAPRARDLQGKNRELWDNP